MALKTFNINQDVYARFSAFCMERGISMSRQVQIFMDAQLEEEPEARKEYLKSLLRKIQNKSPPFKFLKHQ